MSKAKKNKLDEASNFTSKETIIKGSGDKGDKRLLGSNENSGKYYRGLFDEQFEGEAKSISFISENNRRATFKNPSPQELYHFNKRLDEYLVGIGMGWVLGCTVKEVLMGRAA